MPVTTHATGAAQPTVRASESRPEGLEIALAGTGAVMGVQAPIPRESTRPVVFPAPTL